MAELPSWLSGLMPQQRNAPAANPYAGIMGGAAGAPTMTGGGYPRQRMQAYLEWLQQATPEERQDAPGFAPYPARAPDPARPGWDENEMIPAMPDQQARREANQAETNGLLGETQRDQPLFDALMQGKDQRGLPISAGGAASPEFAPGIEELSGMVDVLRKPNFGQRREQAADDWLATASREDVAANPEIGSTPSYLRPSYAEDEALPLSADQKAADDALERETHARLMGGQPERDEGLMEMMKRRLQGRAYSGGI